MMGHRQVEQAALFYEFSLEKHIQADHLAGGLTLRPSSISYSGRDR